MALGIVPGHKRPLPPPLTQQEVLAECQSIQSWTILDSDGGIFMEDNGKRLKLSHKSCDNQTIGFPSTSLPDYQTCASKDPVTTNALDIDSNNIWSNSATKKRLFSSETARIAAKALRDDYKENYHGQHHDAGKQDLCKDKEAEDHRMADTDAVVDAGNEESEAHMLIHLTSTKDVSTQPITSLRDDSMDELEYRRVQEVERGIEASKKLREEAVRKALLDEKNNSLGKLTNMTGATDVTRTALEVADRAATPSSLCYRTSSQSETEPYPTLSADSDRGFDDESEATETAEAGLDLCEAYTQRTSVTEVQEKRSCDASLKDWVAMDKRDCRSKTQSANPYSRTEAQKFSDKHHYTPTNDPNSDATIYGAIRLRELTALHQQKAPTRPKVNILDHGIAHPYATSTNRSGKSILMNGSNDSTTSGPEDGQFFKTLQDGIVTSHDSESADTSFSSGDGLILNTETTLDRGNPAHKVLSPFEQLEAQDKLREGATRAKSDTNKDREVHRSKSKTSSSEYVDYSSPRDIRFILTLPPTFEQRDNDEQQIIIRHEMLKERNQDLMLVVNVHNRLAGLSICESFGPKENSWVKEMQNFSKKVLIEGLCGKTAREKVKRISDSARRRQLKHGLPNQEKVQHFVQTWLGDKFDLLQNELSTIQVKIENARILRLQARKKREQDTSSAARPPKAKRVMNTTASLRLPAHEAITKRNRQNAQYALQDKRLETLRSNREAYLRNSTTDDFDNEEDETSALTIDDGGEESEEDAGADFYAGAGVSQPFQPTQTPDERLLQENLKRVQQRQINEEHQVKQTSQDLRFENKVHAISKARSHAVNPYDRARSEDDPFHHDFDDLLDEHRNEDIDQLCYRYIVSMTCCGIAGYVDGEEYVVARYLNLQHASRRAKELLKLAITEYQARLIQIGDHAMEQHQSTSPEGLQDYRVEFGQDGDMTYRFRVTKETYNPSAEAFENAKIKEACTAKPIYWVLWRKTCTDSTARDVTDNPTPPESQSTEHHITRLDPAAKVMTKQTGNGNQQQRHTPIEERDHQASNDDHDMSDDLLEDLFGSECASPVLHTQEQLKSDIHNHNHINTPIPIQDPTTSQWHHTKPAPTSLTRLPTPPPTNSTISTSSKDTPRSHQTTDLRPHISQDTEEIHYTEIKQFTNIAQANRHASTIYLDWYSGTADEISVRKEESHIEDELISHSDTMQWEKQETIDYEVDNRAVQETFRVWVERKMVHGPAN